MCKNYFLVVIIFVLLSCNKKTETNVNLDKVSIIVKESPQTEIKTVNSTCEIKEEEKINEIDAEDYLLGEWIAIPRLLDMNDDGEMIYLYEGGFLKIYKENNELIAECKWGNDPYNHFPEIVKGKIVLEEKQVKHFKDICGLFSSNVFQFSIGTICSSKPLENGAVGFFDGEADGPWFQRKKIIDEYWEEDNY